MPAHQPCSTRAAKPAIPARSPLSPAKSAAGLMGGAVQGSVGVMMTSQRSNACLCGGREGECVQAGNRNSSTSSAANAVHQAQFSCCVASHRLPVSNGTHAPSPPPEVLLHAGADLLRIQVVGGLKARRHRQADAGLVVHALAAGGVMQRGCSRGGGRRVGPGVGGMTGAAATGNSCMPRHIRQLLPSCCSRYQQPTAQPPAGAQLTTHVVAHLC